MHPQVSDADANNTNPFLCALTAYLFLCAFTADAFLSQYTNNRISVVCCEPTSCTVPECDTTAAACKYYFGHIRSGVAMETNCGRHYGALRSSSRVYDGFRRWMRVWVLRTSSPSLLQGFHHPEISATLLPQHSQMSAPLESRYVA